MNEEYDVQTPVTDVTENTEAQSVEENEEGIELTDTASQEEEKQEVKTYTAEEVERMVNDRLNTLLPKKIEREKRKMEKQYSDKWHLPYPCTSQTPMLSGTVEVHARLRKDDPDPTAGHFQYTRLIQTADTGSKYPPYQFLNLRSSTVENQ